MADTCCRCRPLDLGAFDDERVRRAILLDEPLESGLSA
jgi:hypothetical protein